MAAAASRRRTSTASRGARVTFDNHYVGSLPCMPARRDMQTGRLTFLHRSWGPLEPFDNSFPEILQPGRRLQPPDHRPLPLLGGRRRHLSQPLRLLRVHPRPGGRSAGRRWSQPPLGAAARDVPRHSQFSDQPPATSPLADMINREFIQRGGGLPSVAVLRARPRVPRPQPRAPTTGSCRSRPSTRTSRSIAPDALQARPFTTGWNGPIRDWPRYGRVDELPEESRSCAPTTAALSRCATTSSAGCSTTSTRTTCGRTRRSIVTTDHGFLLGEHDFWAKNRMNMLRGDRAHPAVRPPPATSPRRRRARARR